MRRFTLAIVLSLFTIPALAMDVDASSPETIRASVLHQQVHQLLDNNTELQIQLLSTQAQVAKLSKQLDDTTKLLNEERKGRNDPAQEKK